MTDSVRDTAYFEIAVRHLRVCMEHTPKFGTFGAGGLTRQQFELRYGEDPFYRWVGISSPLMYAAHETAGGITSICRQLGKGGERLFQRVLQDELGLEVEQSFWTYEVPGASGKTRTLEPDGRIDLSHLADSDAKDRVGADARGAQGRDDAPGGLVVAVGDGQDARLRAQTRA